MPRRKLDDLYRDNDTGIASAGQYTAAWEDFVEEENIKPRTNHHFASYFTKLRERGLAASTCWSYYSRLNRTYQQRTSLRLQQWPRLTTMLKGWARNEEVKQAPVFSRDEIESFIKGDGEQQDTPYWVVRRAMCSAIFCGGLRTSEAAGLSYKDVTRVDDGYRVSYNHAKSKRAQSQARFVIPFGTCYYTAFEAYLALRVEAGVDAADGRLWLTGTKNTLTKKALGINMCYAVAGQIAGALGLDGAYTSHSLRRTSATQAAAGGAGLVSMQAHYGWTSTNMAQRYVDAAPATQLHMARAITGGGFPASGVSSLQPHRGGSQVVDININVNTNNSSN